jgi:hypothetical protein
MNMKLSFAAPFHGLDGFARSMGQQIAHYHDLAQGRAGLRPGTLNCGNTHGRNHRADKNGFAAAKGEA